MSEKKNNDNSQSPIGAFAIRVIITALVIAISAFLTPGFRIDGIMPLVIATIVIIVISFALESIIGVGANPFGRGFAGFIISVIVLILTSKLVAGFHIGIFSAIVGSIIIGIVNAIIPSKTF